MVEEWHGHNDARHKDDAPHIAMAAKMCKYRDHLYYFSRYAFVDRRVSEYACRGTPCGGPNHYI